MKLIDKYKELRSKEDITNTERIILDAFEYNIFKNKPSKKDKAEFEELYGHQVTYESYSDLVDDLRDNSNIYQANGKKSSSNYAKKITDNITGIFGIPYQFSSDVDPIMEENPNSANDTDIHVGRKYSQKILSVMPILFLTPGEPMFMGKGHGKGDMALGLAQKLYNALNHEDDNDSNNDIDKDGRYYTFAQNFPEYKKYTEFISN